MQDSQGGAVVSTAINKYLYVIISERYDPTTIRVNYTKAETVSCPDELKHELVREALKKVGIVKGVDIATTADIPSEGSGLGSSSSLTVGLLKAMYTYIGETRGPETLAKEACEIEIDILKKPIGKQDQYIAAFGNLRFIRFCPDDNIEVETIPMSVENKRRLNESLLLFDIGFRKHAFEILLEQKASIQDKFKVLRQLRQLAYQGREALIMGKLDEFGRLMHQGWVLKKQLASRISNSWIDEAYEAAVQAGALGGKVAGAGGGGFLLLYCPREKQDSVRAALQHLREVPFRLEPNGTKILLDIRR
jgi:D-glycero-alpha-D-manno-heptose-7-phosphate kinase